MQARPIYYATALPPNSMEAGTDIGHVQKLMGHQSSKTTEIYTQVSTKDLQKIISPLDRIFNDRELKNNTLAAPNTKSNTDTNVRIP